MHRYFYKVGHKLKDGKYVWGEENFFKSAPNVGEPSLQRVVVYGDMGKVLHWLYYKASMSSLLKLKCDVSDCPFSALSNSKVVSITCSNGVVCTL
jgi:hypothetical protein